MTFELTLNVDSNQDIRQAFVTLRRRSNASPGIAVMVVPVFESNPILTISRIMAFPLMVFG